MPPPVLCDLLTGQSIGVQQRLKQYKDLVTARQCVVLSADPAEDLSEWIKQIPENTVVLLSSNTVSGVTPSSSASPVTTKTPVEYLIDNEIVLKDGQDLIGAADDGFEIVIRLNAGYSGFYMVKVGSFYSFQFGKARDNHIRHVTFQPIGPNNAKTLDSIVFAECYNRKLIVENNRFNISVYRAGLILDCKQSLDASKNVRRQGPGLRFASNKIIGKIIKTWYSDYISKAGIIINLDTIVNQSQRIAVIENSFQGDMAKAGGFTLGFGSNMDIFRNRVDINNLGKTFEEVLSGREAVKEGFSLIGHTSGSEEPPLFNLAGNRISSKNIAIGIEKQIKLALACNHLQAVNPWQQPQRQFSLKAVNPLPLAKECERLAPSSLTLCQIANTWTSITGSTTHPLSGLNNFEGQFLFDTEICPATVPSAPTEAPTSSAGITAVTSALGIIITLSILLAL
ncbi:hypothetical protein [Endozoicomonas sp. 4G]|uniref:hypothetical protein n=1 Tax=Endozoicomonas sp. 4G TaxID=2872754 RepID=UPI002078F616|nr:hypothetical protein [Endozoicomonas sp. 4G]